MPLRISTLIIAFASSTVLTGPLVLGGCGAGHEEVTCGPNGCSVCDGYGCRPADPVPGSVGGSGGGLQDAAPDCDPSVTTCSCAGGEVCGEGTQCIDGLCLVPCEYSSECGGGRICVNGKCVVGCDAQTPCAAGYLCGAKGVCEVDVADPQCGDAKPCTGGLACVQGVCMGACGSNGDCAPGEICDDSTSTCIVDPQPKAPCEKDPSVCTAAQSCVGGYCRYACDSGDGCKLIDARIPICDEHICKSEAEANPQCLSKDDCSAGLDCVSNECI